MPPQLSRYSFSQARPFGFLPRHGIGTFLGRAVLGVATCSDVNHGCISLSTDAVQKRMWQKTKACGKSRKDRAFFANDCSTFFANDRAFFPNDRAFFANDRAFTGQMTVHLRKMTVRLRKMTVRLGKLLCVL